MHANDRPSHNVAGHFDRLSTEWGNHYDGEPRDLPELDLVLRRSVALDFARHELSQRSGRFRVLDVGCGSGDFLAAIDAGAFELVGIDVAAGMLTEASARQPRAAFLMADVRRLPFGADSFDLITSLGVMEYVAEWECALQSIYRALRPGASAILSFPNRQSLFRRLGHAEAAVLRRLRRSSTRGFLVKRREWTLAEVWRILVRAGFEIEQVRLTTYGLKGAIGDRLPLNLALARRIGVRASRESILSRSLAWTITVLCRKRHSSCQPA